MRLRLPALVWFCLGAVAALLIVNICLDWARPPSFVASAAARDERRPLSALALAAVRSTLQRPRVVASFTTFPLGERMAGVAEMLSSLANQTWQPDAVIINLPDRIARLSDKKLEIPPQVEDWQRMYSWLKVHQTQDYGPATKLLGALEVEKDPDTIIVILDDDTYYHRDTILSLVSMMLASPDDIAPCFMCEEVQFTWLGKRQWGYQNSEGACHGFASGYSAYAIRPRFFDHSVFEHGSGPEGCKLHDDVWISGCMLTATGVRPHLIRPGFFSVVGAYIEKKGDRQKESVFVATRVAQSRGEDPQGACVDHFPFASDARRPVM